MCEAIPRSRLSRESTVERLINKRLGDLDQRPHSDRSLITTQYTPYSQGKLVCTDAVAPELSCTVSSTVERWPTTHMPQPSSVLAP